MRAASAKAKPAPARAIVPVRRKLKKPFPRLEFRRWKGKMVASIKPVLVAANANTDHTYRHYQRWASKVPQGFADQAPRQGSKKGGKPEYVATEAVLHRNYEHGGS